MSRSITKYGLTSQGAAFTASPVLNQQGYAANFAVRGGVTNGEAMLTNKTVPLGYDESVKFSVADVKDVYKTSNIDSTLYAPTKSGVSLLVSLDDIWKESDSANAAYEVALPMHAHLVLRVPNNSTLTYDDVLAFVQRLFSFMYEENSTTNTRINDMLKGVLIPEEI